MVRTGTSGGLERFNLMIIFHPSMVQGRMFTRRHQHEVLNPIVRWIMVQMMDYLIWLQVTTKCPFHYKSLFSHIITVISKRMVRAFDEDIPSFVCHPPTFPIPMSVAITGNLLSGFLRRTKTSELMPSFVSLSSSYWDFGRIKSSMCNQFATSTCTRLSYHFSHGSIIPYNHTIRKGV